MVTQLVLSPDLEQQGSRRRSELGDNFPKCSDVYAWGEQSLRSLLPSGRQDSVFAFQQQVISASRSYEPGLVGWNTSVTEVSSDSLSPAGEWPQKVFAIRGRKREREASCELWMLS